MIDSNFDHLNHKPLRGGRDSHCCPCPFLLTATSQKSGFGSWKCSRKWPEVGDMFLWGVIVMYISCVKASFPGDKDILDDGHWHSASDFPLSPWCLCACDPGVWSCEALMLENGAQQVFWEPGTRIQICVQGGYWQNDKDLTNKNLQFYWLKPMQRRWKPIKSFKHVLWDI